MQMLKLAWAPTGQPFDQAKTFNDAITSAIGKVQRAGRRSFTVVVGDDGDSFAIYEASVPTGKALVTCEPEVREQGPAGRLKKKQRSQLQSTVGNPPAAGWYKGAGRRCNLAADPKYGPYFLVVLNEIDKSLQFQSIEPIVRAAREQGVEYPVEAALASNEVQAMLAAAAETDGATFVLVVRDDNPPKLGFRDKWDGSARSMQVLFRRPL